LEYSAFPPAGAPPAEAPELPDLETMAVPAGMAWATAEQEFPAMRARRQPQ
jgi:hypothetical protein